ncbi:MAG: cytochrome c [Pseudomonadota bacterium]|nr:cytochrome c [Pseudomonadota bacterium]
MNRKTIGFAIICGFIYSVHVSSSNDTGGSQGNGMSYEQKLQACSTCHGANGDKPLAPDYPVLAGQHEDYLANSLRAYKDGRRKHPIMNVQVTVLDLNDSDIRRLSRYFSKKEGLSGLGE